VKRFVVIDNEDDELDGMPLFQPLPSTGLTQDVCNGVARFLDGKSDKDMRRNLVVRSLQNLGSMLKGHEG
jgi:hypothetical protein